MDLRAILGRASEDEAAREMVRRGYLVVERNCRDKRGEVDILARKGHELVVVEVRARNGGVPDDAMDSIGHGKQGRVRETTRRWLAFRPEDYCEVRFFVVIVIWRAGKAEVTLIEDAF
jgi:putative endonuclease